ncbi:MAG: hypothetical protein ABT15_28255 [Pseudonocardia sp. SCN 73-27]|nr:MAG: hypothetical protein ABS80_13370 [Pseudonocardia sp. SCN 72-51]ODV01023.1 MAG: hypothetical protein ABT15_28255 [Pseudonocardia sp. SCN 73-27]
MQERRPAAAVLADDRDAVAGRGDEIEAAQDGAAAAGDVAVGARTWPVCRVGRWRSTDASGHGQQPAVGTRRDDGVGARV